MTHHGILSRRLLTVTFLQHLILQTAGKCDDTILLGILGEIFLTSLLMHLALLGALSLDLLLLLGKVFLHDALGVAMRHFQFVTLQHILDGQCKIVGTDVVSTHLGKLLTDTQSQCIA